MNWLNNYNRWINHPLVDENYKNELLKMSEKEKIESFSKNISFGTAGMRGVMGAGTNRINTYNIRKASLGFGKYLLNKFTTMKNISIAIGYDTRFNSKKYAYESAKVMNFLGIKTYVYSSPRPTPMLSFAVRSKKTQGGIMITASHNPKNYNGFKIYDEEGCQYLPEENEIIISYINSIEDELSIKTDSLDHYIFNGLFKKLNLDKEYIKNIKEIKFNTFDKKNLKIVFSSLHGTSYDIAIQLFNKINYKNVYYVKEQCIEDPNFSACEIPNPENKEAFNLAIKIAKKENADVIFLTDPDADRLGIAIKNENDYLFLNGNEMGNLLSYYILNNKKNIEKNSTIITSIVTNDFTKKMMLKLGHQYDKTLIGFKYIGNLINKYNQNFKKKYLFGFEESFGVLYDSNISRDKDALQAITIACEIFQYLKERNITISEYLYSMYKEYGFYKDNLISININNLKGLEKIEEFLKNLRKEPILKIANLNTFIIEDYLTSERKILKTMVVDRINFEKENIIKYILEDESWICFRPSGTEPKLKIYISTTGKNEEEANKKNKIITEKIKYYTKDLLC